MSCENGDCPELIRTSDVEQFDGSFNNIVIPPNSNLNDVLLLMETYFNNTLLDLEDMTYTLAGGTCIGLSAGEYTYQQVVTAIITTLCTIFNNNEQPTDTDNVALSNIVLPDCVSEFEGTTATELFNEILSILCDLVAGLPEDTGVLLPDDTQGWVSVTGKFVSYSILESTHKAIATNHSYVFEHITPTYSPTSLVMDVEPLKSFISDKITARFDPKTLTFGATKDVYVFLNDDGTVTKIEQTIGNPAPSPTSSQILLYEIETDGSGVVSLSMPFDTSPFDPPSIVIGDDEILGNMIDDGQITSAHMVPVATAGTFGHPAVIEITVLASGQIDDYTSNMDLTGITDGQLLAYSSTGNKVVPVDPPSIVAKNRLAGTSMTVYTDTGVGENGVSFTFDTADVPLNGDGIHVTCVFKELSGSTADVALAVQGTATNDPVWNYTFLGVDDTVLVVDAYLIRSGNSFKSTTRITGYTDAGGTLTPIALPVVRDTTLTSILNGSTFMVHFLLSGGFGTATVEDMVIEFLNQA